jgi:murein DD-endopeptidase MepM/ murein hydrolase activator NlpD
MQKLLFLLLFIPFCATAQNKMLLTGGASPDMYINHKVAPKENYYSIGRIYNISPKEIAPYNNLQMEKGLNPGQLIKIPLTNSNFFQSGNADADETFVPVYYAVKDKEGLYRVAQNHNGLPLETLKQWNNIKGETVKKGTVLVVGYLKVKKELSALAVNGIGTSITSTEVAAVKIETKKAEEPVAVVKPKKEESVIVKPAEAEKKLTKAEKKAAKLAKETDIEEAVNNNQDLKKDPAGVFKTLYQNQIKNGDVDDETGMAGVFKSTSGFTDKKYYCLHNKAATGSVIKITNPTNGKFVYAKVLDLMPDIKQNEGMLIIISNAAAEELGAAENNFTCILNYSK